MKVVEISADATDVNALIEQARSEDVILRLPDGTEFALFAIDDFDREIASTRRNQRLMALLEARAKSTEAISLDEVKRQLGLDLRDVTPP